MKTLPQKTVSSARERRRKRSVQARNKIRCFAFQCFYFGVSATTETHICGRKCAYCNHSLSSRVEVVEDALTAFDCLALQSLFCQPKHQRRLAPFRVAEDKGEVEEIPDFAECGIID